MVAGARDRAGAGTGGAGAADGARGAAGPPAGETLAGAITYDEACRLVISAELAAAAGPG
ncbi:MAG: hypothetical protein ABSB59_28960 [Streptosporangiaceae bacterium]